MRQLVIAFAFSAFSLFAQSSQASLQSYFEQGEKALAEGRYSDAQAAYEKLEKLAPNVAEVYGRLGLVYFQQKRFEEAVPALRKALKLKPSLPNTDILLGMALSETGHYAEAIPGLEKGFRKGNDAELTRMSGLQLERVYTGLHRDHDAVQTALELTRLYPDDPEILYNSGRLFGNYAFLSMQKLADVAPDSVWRHEASGDAFQSEGKYELAAAEFRVVIAQEPNRPGAHYRLGRALLSIADSRAAAAGEFEQELTLDPSNANAAYELAELHRKAAEYEKARELFNLALKHYPDFADALVGLGRTLVSLGQAKEATSYLIKATSINPRDAVAYYQLSLAYKAQANTAEQRKALDTFQRLKAENAKHVELLHSNSAVTKQEVDPEAANY